MVPGGGGFAATETEADADADADARGGAEAEGAAEADAEAEDAGAIGLGSSPNGRGKMRTMLWSSSARYNRWPSAERINAPPTRSGAFRGTCGATLVVDAFVVDDVVGLGPDERLSLQADADATAATRRNTGSTTCERDSICRG